MKFEELQSSVGALDHNLTLSRHGGIQVKIYGSNSHVYNLHLQILV